MNCNFIAHGLLCLLGATFLALAGVYAAGSALVGTFHSAAMAILGIAARRSGVEGGYGVASTIIGALGSACILALQAGGSFRHPRRVGARHRRGDPPRRTPPGIRTSRLRRASGQPADKVSHRPTKLAPLLALIAPLLPPHPARPKGGRLWLPDRPALCGILFVLRSGRHRRVVERTLAYLAHHRRPTFRYKRHESHHRACLDLGCALVCFDARTRL